ncbi:MAG: sensor histidine kinase, partial [Nocardioides sp.]
AASWRQLEVYDTISVDFGRGQGGLELAAYAVAAALVLAVAEAARRSGERASRVRALEARAGEVEQQSAVTEERARLARDLHDVVAHHVSLIAVRAETAPYTTSDLGDGGKEVLAEIAADSRRALDELRGVLGVLQRSRTDPELAPQPTAADLPDLVARAADAGEPVTWTDGPSGLAEVPAPIGYAAYRVLQEALTNARRHAPGRPVEVSVRGSGSGLWLRVVTRLAASVPDQKPGRGLTGARERVEALGGTFLAGPAGDTFVVEADLRG